MFSLSGARFISQATAAICCSIDNCFSAAQLCCCYWYLLIENIYCMLISLLCHYWFFSPLLKKKFLLSNTDHLVICIQDCGKGKVKVWMLYKGIEQRCVMQEVEKKSSYVCLVYTDAENLVRLDQMTGDVTFKPSYLLLSIQDGFCYFMGLMLGNIYTATKDKVDWFELFCSIVVRTDLRTASAWQKNLSKAEICCLLTLELVIDLQSKYALLLNRNIQKKKKPCISSSLKHQ